MIASRLLIQIIVVFLFSKLFDNDADEINNDLKIEHLNIISRNTHKKRRVRTSVNFVKFACFDNNQSTVIN